MNQCTNSLVKWTVYPADQVARVMGFWGITLPLGVFGPPIFNIIYRASLGWAACGETAGQKDWCRWG